MIVTENQRVQQVVSTYRRRKACHDEIFKTQVHPALCLLNTRQPCDCVGVGHLSFVPALVKSWGRSFLLGDSGQSRALSLLNRADSGANAVTTEGNHGRLSYPAALKSLGIQASCVRVRDKALRFPMGKVNRKHIKSIPRLLYTELVMRAPTLGALRPPTITRVAT